MIALLLSLLGGGGVVGLVLHFVGLAGVKKAAGRIPPKVWQFLAIAVAIGFAVWFLEHRGEERAKAAAERQRLERAEITNAVVRAVDDRLDHRLGNVSRELAGKLLTIDTEGKTIVQPMLTREILRDRGLSDPGRCLSPGLLDAVNAARGFLDSERLAGGTETGADPRPADPRAVPAGKPRR